MSRLYSDFRLPRLPVLVLQADMNGSRVGGLKKVPRTREYYCTENAPDDARNKRDPSLPV